MARARAKAARETNRAVKALDGGGFENCERNQFGAPDFSRLVWSDWYDLDLPRCMICHPYPVGPFTDCIHGHILTAERVQAQALTDLKRIAWSVGIAVFAFVWLIDAEFIVVPLAIIAVLRFLRRRKHMNETIRMIQTHPETPYFLWETKAKGNEPWPIGTLVPPPVSTLLPFAA